MFDYVLVGCRISIPGFESVACFLYGKTRKMRQCLWLQKFTQQKIFLYKDLNFYLEQNKS